MKSLPFPFLLFILSTNLFAKCVGFESTLMFPAYDDHKGLAFTGSIFSALPLAHGMIENGIIFKPSTGSLTPHHNRESIGTLMGYTFLPEIPLIRPGFVLGIAYDRWVEDDKSLTWKLQPFFGAKVQLSFLSFLFTGRGVGVGLNFNL